MRLFFYGSPLLYKLRNRIEHWFNRLRQFWRIATHYGMFAGIYSAMIELATVQNICLLDDSKA